MNTRLIKETRDLLPIFAGTLPLIVVPQLIWPPAGFGCFALGVACVLMAGNSFGSEFQHRTLSLLLSQPIARSVVWREKMLVLGTGMLASLVALLVCLAVRRPVIDGQDWLVLALVPLCAFCGAPCWTLSLRHGIGGMVAAVAVPCSILAVIALVTQQLGGDLTDALFATCLALLLIYCALVYWLGYATFKRLEAVEASARELSLPVGLEAFFVRPLTRASSGFRGPFATLLKKEFRLQQISFLLAGMFVLFAVVGACLIKRYPNLGEGIVGADCFIYALILPLIAGATSVAEEKGWGITEWHLTLPPSALKQWSAKMLAALSTSLVLGLVLPIATFLAGLALFGQLGARGSLPSAPEILCWPLGSLLLTSVAIYAASISTSTLRAILGTVGIAVAAYAVCFLVGVASVKASRGLVSSTYLSSPGPHVIPLLLAGGLFFMLCVVQWFAWSNYRRYRVPARKIVAQVIAILICVGLTTLVLLLTYFILSIGPIIR
jgi:ABC-type transport system involved in multi-copper enzyme maturation permease subunit